MCGRDFLTYSDKQLHSRYLNTQNSYWAIDTVIPPFSPSYNFCPTQQNLVLSVYDGRLGFRQMRWGLVPAWAKTVKDADKYSMINAKSEEIADKRSYAQAFRQRRCIVPISGFYEWLREGKLKKPFAIYLKDESIMSLAAIWEHWVDSQTKESVLSYSLVTTAANSFMSKIHHRMPVILSKQDEEKWLDPKQTNPSQLSELMKSCPDEWLAAHEVSSLVNSPKNNQPGVLAPME